MHIILLALFLQAAPPQPTPELTNIEQIAVTAIIQNFQQNLAKANEDIKKSHPGYQLDNQNPMKLAPISAQPTQAQQPAKAPDKK